MFDFNAKVETWPEVKGRLDIQQSKRLAALTDCKHALTTLRFKKCSNGTRQYAYQCDKCGCLVGTILPKPELRVIVTLPEWDDSIRSRYCEDRRKNNPYEINRQEQDRVFWAYYNSYLETKRWQQKRQMVMERAKGICEGCLFSQATQVHHLSYNNLGDELLFELVAICEKCHQKTHGK